MKHPFNLSIWQNTGHCQINYWTRNEAGQKIFYCLQDQGDKYGGVRLMRATVEYEPSHEVTISGKISFENPFKLNQNSEYSEKLKKLCFDWIEKNGEIL